MAITLRFTKPWPNAVSPIKLRFVDVGTVNVAVAATIPVNVVAAIEVRELPIDRSFGIEIGVCWAELSPAEQSLLLGSGSDTVEVALETAHSSIAPLDTGLWLQCYAGAMLCAATIVQNQQRAMVNCAIISAWTFAAGEQMISSMAWTLPDAMQQQCFASWRNHTAEQLQAALAWADGLRVETAHVIRYRDITGVNADVAVTWGYRAPRWICSTKYRPPVGKVSMRFSEPLGAGLSPITLRFTPSDEYCYWDDGGGVIDGSPILLPIDFKVPIEPQIQRTYLMQPTLTCHRVSDNRELAITSARLSRRRGQWAWDGSIDWASKGDMLLAHNELLRISINGYAFYLIAEQSQSRSGWLQDEHSSQCRGRSAVLSDPWLAPISYTNTAQSFGGLLQSLLANTGWQAQLVGVTDFAIPAGVYSVFAKDPIAAVSEAAAQVGAVVIPDDANKKLKIVPRWPVVPWAMASAIADVALHDSVIFSVSEAEQLAPLYNACWVRGEQNGISREIVRQGSGGTAPAPDVTAALIVDVQAAIMAGTAAIADSGRTKAVSLDLPIMAQLPPLTPGQLIGITYRGDVYKATVDAISLSASRSDSGLEISQSASLIRHLEH